MRRWVRRHRSAHPIGVAAVATLVALATSIPFANAQDASDASSPDEPVVLTVGTTVDLITDNPWAVSAGSDWSVVTAQYDMLLKFDSESASPAPSLATG
ncbi:MAG: hypothetical protein ACXWZC_11625, partial [Actinomycetota bacterium]